ncbi:MAG: hypothetical protein WBA22_06885 [Candidatus Methanofastidiosia archaeon]
MLEIEGIYAQSFKISFLKVSIYHHPEMFGREIKIVFNIELVFDEDALKNDRIRNNLEIFLNTKPGTEITKLEDLNHKIETEYAQEIGACWEPDDLIHFEIENIIKEDETIEGKYPFIEEDKRVKGKYPYYFNKKSGKIEIHLEFAEKAGETGSENARINKKAKECNKEGENLKNENNKEKGMIFFAIYLKGNFLEEDSWWKKLLGLSSYAWEFPYIFWSHNEKSLIPAESIKKCESAQTFIIIPKKMIKSINRVSCIPGSDHLHEMTDNDIATSCRFETDKSAIEGIKKWVEPGSISLGWEFSNTLKLSKKIALGHLDAYPRSTSILLFFFLISLCLTYLIIPCNEIQCSNLKKIIAPLLVIYVLIFFLISEINYSFHNIRRSQIPRGVYDTIGIIITCFLVSFGLYGPIPWKLLIEKELFSEIPPVSWVLMVSPMLVIFAFISYRKEIEFFSAHDSRLTATIIITIQCIVILALSVFFAFSLEGDSGSQLGLNVYSICKYWALNNLYAIIGIKGVSKLIE